MRKHLLVIWILLLAARFTAAGNTISIPLTKSVFYYMQQDNPTTSTPDPTDPNQFRVTLTGNTLLIETQKDLVSYVVIQETQSDQNNEDYFYGLSYGAISCTILHAGSYTIRIGCWKTDFTGYLYVKSISLLDLNGHLVSGAYSPTAPIPSGYYLLRVETSLGVTTTKFYRP